MTDTFDLSAITPAELAAMQFCAGTGRVDVGEHVHLEIGRMARGTYANAQIDDYHQDNRYCWRPPLRLAASARFSSPGQELKGTAGFGFWNDPLGMTGRIRLRPPQSVWFFHAGGPNFLPLLLGDPGTGWRASTVNAAQIQAGLVLPAAPFLAVIMRLQSLKRPIWRWLQRRLRLTGTALDETAMQAWQRYEIYWRESSVRFVVNEQEVLLAPVRVQGPLGWVAWIDNQYMVAAPEGWLRHGTVEIDQQWLELDDVTIERLH